MQEKINITLDEEIIKELKDTKEKIGIPVSVQIQKSLQKNMRGSKKN